MIGCATCRSKKVKCDEQREKCGRCCRLHLLCSWQPTEPQPPLRVKRRGCGSLKSRGDSWKPKQIFPALPPTTSFATAVSVSESTQKADALSDMEPCIDGWVGSEEWWETIEIDAENLDWSEFPNDELDDLSPPVVFGNSSADLDQYEALSSMSVEGARSSTNATLTISPSRPLSDHHFTVPNGLDLLPFEHQALHHYQTVFSTYRSTKDPKWSTHKMLLNYGSYNPMIMRFILAVSINDYSIRTSNEQLYQGAQDHFGIASGLWVETMKKGQTSDHLAVMTSFFFLYLYMTKRRNVTHHRLRKLSKSVVDFVKRHKLDTRCLGSTRSPSPDQVSGGSATMTIRQRSLLARLIMWTFDEDVKCGFQGSGGHLAQYLSENDIRTKNIYDASRSVLENHWGSDYPDYQVFDEIGRAHV